MRQARRPATLLWSRAMSTAPSSQATGDTAPISHARILALAGPIILSNVSVPLLGVVDTAIVGRLDDPAFIGAVAVGATLFSFLYWSFGFLRMGTTGLTAQARGARDGIEVTACLARALMIAGAAGGALILLQALLAAGAFPLMDASAEVEGHARTYFAIRIWSAPAALGMFALVGWFVGLSRTRTVLVLQLLLNGLNIALDLVLGLWMGWGVVGVAVGTVIAEWTATLTGLAIALAHARKTPLPSWAQIVERARLVRTIAVNRDIMIRSILLLLAFAIFTREGARAGDLTLAANAVLIHFFHVSAYALDGFAFAVEALVGEAIGGKNRNALRRAVRLTTLWSAGAALFASLVYLAAGGLVIDLLTILPEVRAEARVYVLWAALAPLTGVWCFLLDGIFIGATRGREMRNAMIAAFAVYLAAWATLIPAFGNHGLWATIHVFFIARALTLLVYYPRVVGDAEAR